MDLDNLIIINEVSKFNLPLVEINGHYFNRSDNYDELLDNIYIKANRILEIANKKYNSTKIVAKLDLLNTRLNQIDYTFFKQLIEILQNKYKNNLEKIEVHNCNIIMQGVYKLIEPFIRESTRNKIVFI